MKAPASAPASSAYGKEVFVETFVESFKKVNMATIRARSAESVQLVKEKLKEIDWEEVRAQMKNFNVELVKPFKQAKRDGFTAYLKSTFTLEGPQVENSLDGFNQYNSLCFWWGAFEALLSLLFGMLFAPLVIVGGYLAAMTLWWIFNLSQSKKWKFVGLTLIMFYACWVILQIFATFIFILLPAMFAIKLFLTVGMLKYGASLEAEPEGNCPYDTLPEDGKTGGDTVNSDANEML